MDGWRWVHTPGHTPGHVSFYRASDSCLIAGDAISTQRQESLAAVLTNHLTIHGPPAYFTTDWWLAEESVRLLATLRPHSMGCGHGLPLAGDRLRQALDLLVRDFDRIARPVDGRYVREPARADVTGVTYVPPAVFDPFPLAAAGGVALLALGLYAAHRRRATG